MGGFEDVRLDHQVVVKEIRRIGVVGEDSTDLGGRHEHRVGFGLRHPDIDRHLVDKIDLFTPDSHDLSRIFLFKAAHQR